MIDPSFWTDEKLSEISIQARIMFIGMWNFADDEGILRLRPEYIKSSIFPYDDIELGEIKSWIDILIKINLIYAYQINGQSYGIILNFLKHQSINRPVPSKLPHPSIQNVKYANAIHERDGWICHLCGENVKDHNHDLKDPKFPSLDHIVPVSKGGNDMPENLKTACISCNKSRGNKNINDNSLNTHEQLTHQEKRREEKLKEIKRREENAREGGSTRQRANSSSDISKGAGTAASPTARKGKPFYWDQEMRFSKGRWWVLPKEGGAWKEFNGKKADIVWK